MGGGGTEKKGPGGAASSHGSMRGGRLRREAATEGQAVWRGTNAQWVCKDTAVYHGGREGSSDVARDRGEAVCDAVCGWALRLRRTRQRDERQEGPGRSETEKQVDRESREDRYWRSRAYSRKATMSRCTSAAQGSRQGGRQLEGARRPLAGSVGPIVGRRVVERHSATWILREILLFCRESADLSNTWSLMMKTFSSCLSMD
jgi:hypothetical protein